MKPSRLRNRAILVAIFVLGHAAGATAITTPCSSSAEPGFNQTTCNENGRWFPIPTAAGDLIWDSKDKTLKFSAFVTATLTPTLNQFIVHGAYNQPLTFSLLGSNWNLAVQAWLPIALSTKVIGGKTYFQMRQPGGEAQIFDQIPPGTGGGTAGVYYVMQIDDRLGPVMVFVLGTSTNSKGKLESIANMHTNLQTNIFYDTNGNPNLIQSPYEQTTISYDPCKRPSQVNNSAGEVLGLEYPRDSGGIVCDGHIASVSGNYKGQKSLYTYYDSPTPFLLKKVVSLPGREYTLYTYDSGSITVRSQSSAGSPATVTQLGFDSNHRNISLTSSVGNIIAQSTNTGYDSLGRVTSSNSQDGHNTATTWPTTTPYCAQSLYRPLSVTNSFGSTPTSSLVYTYSTTAPANCVEFGQPVTETTTLGTATPVTTTRTYDPACGTVTSESNLFGTTTYLYDTYCRLSSQTDTPASSTTSFTYDPRGNPLTVTGPSGTTTLNFDSYSRPNSIAANGFTTALGYNSAGQPTSEANLFGTRSFAYDSQGRQSGWTSNPSGGGPSTSGTSSLTPTLSASHRPKKKTIEASLAAKFPGLAARLPGLFATRANAESSSLALPEGITGETVSGSSCIASECSTWSQGWSATSASDGSQTVTVNSTLDGESSNGSTVMTHNAPPDPVETVGVTTTNSPSPSP